MGNVTAVTDGTTDTDSIGKALVDYPPLVQVILAGGSSRRFGSDKALAILAGTLVGPAQVAARLFEFGLMRALHPVWSARIAVILHPFGALLLALFGPAAIAPFALAYGAGNGIITIARGTLPLAIFGPIGYGLRTGLLAAPGRFAVAAAPFLFGLLLDRFGTLAVFLTVSLNLAAFASLLLLRPQPAPTVAPAASG